MYQVIARKYRPQTFSGLVGQSHVRTTLENAISQGRIAHGYIFSGQRGTGKTTVARILARCLNCVNGPTPQPCGVCSSCTEVAAGNAVDVIEIDAASNRGINEMRELRENVRYRPARDRYKVFIVDEAHQITHEAFNALLKTLEEPPPHVKFLFATTDPQKLPVTVLSRCLQFNLKRLPMALIVGRMSAICDSEHIKAEPGALTRLARAAAGSMRDGLSLLDQALAYGNETLRESDVAEMLGSIDRNRVLALLEALAEGDAAGLLRRIRELDELAPDYGSLLDDIATVLQRLAIIQIAGEAALDEEDDVAALTALASRFDPETTQLNYQIAVTSRRDLPVGPDPRIGFEMAVLRMLAFRPEPVSQPAMRAPGSVAAPAAVAAGGGRRAESAAPLRVGDEWTGFVQGLSLDGAARQLAMHTALVSSTATELRLSIDPANAHLLTEQQKNRVIAAIRERRGAALQVTIELRSDARDTLAARAAEEQGEALRRARDAIESDPNVRELSSMFGAELVPGSIKPVVREDKGPRRDRGGRRPQESKERNS